MSGVLFAADWSDPMLDNPTVYSAPYTADPVDNTHVRVFGGSVLEGAQAELYVPTNAATLSATFIGRMSVAGGGPTNNIYLRLYARPLGSATWSQVAATTVNAYSYGVGIFEHSWTGITLATLGFTAGRMGHVRFERNAGGTNNHAGSYYLAMGRFAWAAS